VSTRRLHPLHSVNMVLDDIRRTGCYFDERRGTGRTTALALQYIAAAISNPFCSILIRDHHGSTQSDRMLVHVCRQMVHTLGLYEFHFTEGTICFGERPRAPYYVLQSDLKLVPDNTFSGKGR
jgi:hypothetical protein